MGQEEAEETTGELDERELRARAAGEREVRSPREAPAQLRQMIAIGVVSSIVGIAVGLLIDWFPVQASGQAKPIDTLWDVLIIASVPVFVLCQVIVLYSVWKFRMLPGEENLDGPPIHGNTRLEVIWTAIPAILLVALCTYAYIVLVDIEDAKADALEVRVVGEQFAWSYHYSGAGRGGRDLTTNALYLPVDRPVNFTVQTKDVIHDFWVPAFRLKVDAVAGVDTGYRVTPTRRGTYPVVCAELCGLGHSTMRSTVRVVTRPEFDRWLAGQRTGGAGGAAAAGGSESGGGAEQAGADGKQVFASTGCGSCHTLADAGSQANTGPNLEVLKGQSAEQIEQSIVDPNATLSEGFQANLMPADYGQRLDPEQLKALVDYLSESTK